MRMAPLLSKICVLIKEGTENHSLSLIKTQQEATTHVSGNGTSPHLLLAGSLSVGFPPSRNKRNKIPVLVTYSHLIVVAQTKVMYTGRTRQIRWNH